MEVMMAQESPEYAAMKESLQAKTGKAWDEWLHIARSSGIAKHGELVKYLKDTYSIGHGYANRIAHDVNQSAADMTDDSQQLIEQQYGGAKAVLRPIYDKLMAEIGAFGDDVQFVPMKAYVSVKRKKQFAILHPATNTRFELGIKLKDAPADTRLETGGFNGMVSHRVKILTIDEVDQQVLGWLRQAYEGAG
jgi:predicted transport protein